jgi:hypothetical protein
LQTLSIVFDVAFADSLNAYAQAQAAGPHTAGVLRAAAIFENFKRAHAQTAAEIGGFANASGDNAFSAQSFRALLEIHADVFGLRARRCIASTAASG